MRRGGKVSAACDVTITVVSWVEREKRNYTATRVMEGAFVVGSKGKGEES